VQKVYNLIREPKKMVYKRIKIPGGGTQFEDAPTIKILSASDQLPDIVIRYHAQETTGGQPPIFGEIAFQNVLEYRWISDVLEYYSYADDKDFEFGLIQITNSRYLEDIASKGRWPDALGHRFGPYLEESKVKHFRLAFDEYG
jgi:hypothetical protein